MIHVIFSLPTEDKNGNPCDISRNRTCGALCDLFEDGVFDSRQFRAAVPLHKVGDIARAVEIIKDMCYVDKVLTLAYMPDEEASWL